MKYLDVVMNLRHPENDEELKANTRTLLNYIVEKLTSFNNIDLLEITEDDTYKYAYFSIHGQSNIKLMLRVCNSYSHASTSIFSLSLKGELLSLTNIHFYDCDPGKFINSEGVQYNPFNFHFPYITDSDNNLKAICYYTDYSTINKFIFMDADDNNIYVGIVDGENLECYECNNNIQIYKGKPTNFCGFNITIVNTEICVTRDIVMALDSNVYLLPKLKSIQTVNTKNTCDCLINGIQTSKIGFLTVL